MDSFFFVQRTMIFLFYTVRSNSFTRPLSRFKEKVQFAYCIDLLLKGTRKETTYHGPRPFIFYHYLKQFHYAISGLADVEKCFRNEKR